MVISHIFTSLGLDEVQKITFFGIFARNGVFFGKKMERESPKIIEKSKERKKIRIFLVGIQKMFFSVFQVFFFAQMGSEPCVEGFFSASLLLISCVTSNLDSSKNSFRVVHVHYPYAPTLTTVLSNHFCLSFVSKRCSARILERIQKRIIL